MTKANKSCLLEVSLVHCKTSLIGTQKSLARYIEIETVNIMAQYRYPIVAIQNCLTPRNPSNIIELHHNLNMAKNLMPKKLSVQSDRP